MVREQSNQSNQGNPANEFADHRVPPAFADDYEFAAPPPFPWEHNAGGQPEGARPTTLQRTELEYSNVGNIPNVNPRTAHVSPQVLRHLMKVPPCHPQAILRFVQCH